MTRLLAACLLPLLCAGPIMSQEARVPFGQGTHAFRKLLADLHLEPLTDVARFNEDPSRTLVIILGRTDVLAEARLRLPAFVRQGGALLVATDRWVPPWDWPVTLNTVIPGTFVEVPADSPSAYRGLRECPLLVPMEDAVPPLARGLARIATNRPSYLGAYPARWQVLARFPDDCRFANGNRLADVGSRLGFAVAGTLGSGRALVLADHSVFINDMMLQTDNDNIEFAYNCIDWLCGRGQRQHVLFIEEGEVLPTFQVDLKDLPPPPLPPIQELLPWAVRVALEMEKEGLVTQANQSLARLEQENAATRFLHAHMDVAGWLRVLLVLLTIGLGLLGVLWLVRARPWKAPHTPTLTATLPAPAGDASLFDQRHRAMVQDGNLWEAARDAARQGLASLGYPPAAEPLPRPVTEMDAGWWRRWQLRRRVRRLWRLAYGKRPAPVSLEEYLSLAQQLRDLQAAGVRVHGDGRRHQA